MSKKFLIENNINNIVTYKKLSFDCLSMKQKSHLNKKFLKRKITNYYNSTENSENININ